MKAWQRGDYLSLELVNGQVRDRLYGRVEGVVGSELAVRWDDGSFSLVNPSDAKPEAGPKC